MLAKLAEDNRIEQLTTEKKRLKTLQIRKEVEEEIAERRRQRAIEMQRLMVLLEQEKQEEERKRQLIEEERRRIIAEHADDVLCFLPKHTVQAEDLPYLGDKVRQKYQSNR